MAFTLSRTQRRIIGAVVLLPIVFFGLYIWTAMHWTYSSGERAGYVQKFSKKGWVCKTWEGELAMVALPGTLPGKFLFTVRNDSIASHINASLGKRVALSYEQHVGIPTSCFGETGYWVTEARLVE
jgi:hypothetical protein